MLKDFTELFNTKLEASRQKKAEESRIQKEIKKAQIEYEDINNKLFVIFRELKSIKK